MAHTHAKKSWVPGHGPRGVTPMCSGWANPRAPWLRGHPSLRITALSTLGCAWNIRTRGIYSTLSHRHPRAPWHKLTPLGHGAPIGGIQVFSCYRNNRDFSGAYELRPEREDKHGWSAVQRAKIMDVFCLRLLLNTRHRPTAMEGTRWHWSVNWSHFYQTLSVWWLHKACWPVWRQYKTRQDIRN